MNKIDRLFFWATLVVMSFSVGLVTSCGWEAVPVIVRVNPFAEATVAETVVISLDGVETEYSDQAGQSTIALGELAVGTRIEASVTSETGGSKVEILVDNCFRDSDRCEEDGCTATAEYMVQVEKCEND